MLCRKVREIMPNLFLKYASIFAGHAALFYIADSALKYHPTNPEIAGGTIIATGIAYSIWICKEIGNDMGKIL